MWKFSLSGAGTAILYESVLPMFTMTPGQNLHVGEEGTSKDVLAIAGRFPGNRFSLC